MEKFITKLHEVYGSDTPLEKLMSTRIDVSDPRISTKFLEMLQEVYEQRMPFNRMLGVHIDSLTMEKVVIGIDKKPDLVGNFEQNILHGGVISAVIDLTGGIIIQANALRNMRDCTLAQMLTSFAKMSTVNMRVDYLRPGFGEHFKSTAHLMRIGNKVAVTRMEFQNEKDDLIAIGTGTYLVG